MERPPHPGVSSTTELPCPTHSVTHPIPLLVSKHQNLAPSALQLLSGERQHTSRCVRAPAFVFALACIALVLRLEQSGATTKATTGASTFPARVDPGLAAAFLLAGAESCQSKVRWKAAVTWQGRGLLGLFKGRCRVGRNMTFCQQLWKTYLISLGLGWVGDTG